MLEPVSKSRVSETAVESIKSFIAHQKLTPGAKLPSERELSEALNISRTSVREALRTLEIMGLIEVKPGSGVYFKDSAGDLSVPLKTWLPSNEETLREIFEVRQLIEPNIASLAAQRITPEGLEKLRICTEKFCHCFEEDDLPGMILADTQFHRLLASGTGNKTLSFIMNTITRFMPGAWKASLRVPHRPERTIQEHQKIIDAIREHDPALARQAMALHLEKAIVEIEHVTFSNNR